MDRRLVSACARLQHVSALDPGVPILNCLLSSVVNRHSHQLNQWDCQQSVLPSDVDEHVVLAYLFWRHATHLHDLTNPQWRRSALSYASGLEWKSEMIVEVVVPAHP